MIRRILLFTIFIHLVVGPLYTRPFLDWEIEMIVNSHNTLRRAVARGELLLGDGSRAPPAQNMHKLAYTTNFEPVCAMNYRCVPTQVDEISRNAYVSLSNPKQLRDAITSWLKPPDNIGLGNDYCSFPQTAKGFIRSFYKAMHAESTLIGCSRWYCSVARSHVVQCAYGNASGILGGPQLNKPIYLPGSTCNACADSCEDSLCTGEETTEVLDTAMCEERRKITTIPEQGKLYDDLNVFNDDNLIPVPLTKTEENFVLNAHNNLRTAVARGLLRFDDGNITLPSNNMRLMTYIDWNKIAPPIYDALLCGALPTDGETPNTTATPESRLSMHLFDWNENSADAAETALWRSLQVMLAPGNMDFEFTMCKHNPADKSTWVRSFSKAIHAMSSMVGCTRHYCSVAKKYMIQCVYHQDGGQNTGPVDNQPVYMPGNTCGSCPTCTDGLCTKAALANNFISCQTNKNLIEITREKITDVSAIKSFQELGIFEKQKRVRFPKCSDSGKAAGG